MLSLTNITKCYSSGDAKTNVLKGLSINFRKNEFLSILGPSGCGKTTTLNIIGGLDHYTDGNLIIDGKSTKDYRDSDWDSYRNHKIGFVFQSYNLIPHLTVEKNVEMALSLNNTKPKDRRKRVTRVLKQVGLFSQINKMPNQLSGGQMQRVAIARALANDPEIILADEPTGALDSKTSMQVMKILKKISKKKLVIMVTHSEELAKQYSTRIISLSDGQVINDTMPYTNEELLLDENKETIKQKKVNSKSSKSCMNFFNALALSFKNLLTKKGRSFLTAFAGSIGIIGIALVLALSNGFTKYVVNVQSNTLSSYPISISAATIDYSKISSLAKNTEDLSTSNNVVNIYENGLNESMKYGHYNYLGKDFVQKVKNFEQINALKNSNINLVQFNNFVPLKFLIKDSIDNIIFAQNYNSLSLMSGTGKGIFYEALADDQTILNEYDEAYKSIDYDKNNPYGLTLVMEKGNKISKSILLSLGYNAEKITDERLYDTIPYEDICKKDFKLLFNDDYYNFNEINNNFETLDINNQTNLINLYNKADITLKITRILTPKKESNLSLLSSGIMYSTQLANEYLNNCRQSLIAQKQQILHDRQTENIKYDFYAPFVIQIIEFASMLPSNGFKSTAEINSYLNSIFKINLTKEEAYELAMQQIGISSIPQSIVFYPKNFQGKEQVTNFIDRFNNELNTSNTAHYIIYTDNSNMLIKSLSSIINIVSYILMAFAGISLIVSSIMIGIITYVSVIERTKEIGILRSIGARKKDVSRVFNAETIIIGFTAGAIGIALSYILTVPINLIVNSLTDTIKNIAILNPLHALALIGISMFLTFISGLVPATIASKKDPVVCLRTE